MKPLDFTKYSDRQQFYCSREWRMLRAFKLHINPLCEICLKKNILKPAEEVHHIVDIKDEPELALVMSNLQSLCKKCHSKITYSEGSLKKYVEYQKRAKQLNVYNKKWAAKL